MGSFNTTCFMTGQTIAPGNKAYIIPIIQSIGWTPIQLKGDDKVFDVIQSFDLTCHSNAFWSIAGGFVAAEYDDYGRFIIEDTKANRAALAPLFERHFFETVEGENSCHDLPFDPASIDVNDPVNTLTKMWDAMVHERRVYVRDRNRQPAMVNVAVISAHAFNSAVAMINTHKGWDGKSYHIEDLIAECIELVGLTYYALFRELELGEAFRFQRTAELRQICEDGFNEENTEALRQMFRERHVVTALESMNLKIQPMVYTSQDYDNEIGRMCSKFIAEVEQRISAEQKTRYGEDDEA